MSIEAAQELFDRLHPTVWIVTSQSAERRGGLVATFVSPASIVPSLPRVLVGISRQHHTRQLVEESGALALHLIAEEHLHWVWNFGLRSGRDVDKLAGLRVRAGVMGSPVLEEAVGWLECRVEARMETGDRTIYLAEVVEAEVVGERPALTVCRLLELAPPAEINRLRELTVRDSAADAEAIRAWREERRGPARPSP